MFFSSDNLVEWTDHGVILTQHDVPGLIVPPTACGHLIVLTETRKYYFFFPSQAKAGNEKRGFRIGGGHFGKTLWSFHS